VTVSVVTGSIVIVIVLSDRIAHGVSSVPDPTVPAALWILTETGSASALKIACARA
jgi:hypothetical protein